MRRVQQIEVRKLSATALVVALLCAPIPAATAIQPQDKAMKLAVASIRPIPAGTPIQARALGIACRGTDGVRQLVTAVKIGVDPVLVPPQGRCMANGITLQSVIGFAYGIPARNISGGPDWIRLSGPTSLDDDSFTLRQAETFFIEAVAESPATATTEELKEMLGTMLEDRFGLKFHRETRQAKGYALVVAKDGPKIQEVSSGYESPRATFDETLRRSIKGTSKLNELIDILLPPAFEPFVDRTGLTGTYRYEFLAPLPPPPAPPSPRRDATAGPGAPERLGEIPPPSSAIPTLSGSLEAQLGLRLQPDTVAVEMLVIDHVERPSSN